MCVAVVPNTPSVSVAPWPVCGAEVGEMKSCGKVWEAARPWSALLIIFIFSSIIVIITVRDICVKTGSLFVVSVFFFSFLTLLFPSWNSVQ